MPPEQQPSNTQPAPQPAAPTMQAVPPAGAPVLHETRQAKLLFMIAAVLAGLFFIGMIIFATKATTTSAKLKEQYDLGDSAGRAAQKKQDTRAYNKQTVSSTHTYVAPTIDGSFQVSYPKAWSLTTNANSSDPLIGLINPEYVDQTAKKYALRFNLKNSAYDQVKRQYDDKVKSAANVAKLGTPKLVAQAVTVSGIKGQQYTGVIWDDSKLTGAGTVIILPLRDKTMILTTDDNSLYLDSFKQMLSTIKLFP